MINKFYKTIDNDSIKLIKYNGANKESDGNPKAEIVEIKTSENGGSIKFRYPNLGMHQYTSNKVEMKESEYEALKDIALNIIDSVKALSKNIQTEESICL